VDGLRRDAEPGRRAAGRRAGRGDEGIGAVVDVEEDPLGAFEEDLLAPRRPLVEELRDVPDVGHELLRPTRVLLEHGLGVEGGQAEGPQDGILGGDVLGDLLPEHPEVGQVAGPDAQSGRLVLVGRADPAAGRPDLLLAAPVLRDPLGKRVPGHDQVRAPADGDPLRPDADALRFEIGGLLEKGRGREHEPVADDAESRRMEDARGDEVEDDLAAPDVDRVPGVMAPLITGDDIEGRGQQVDDLALAFVAPLSAENEEVGHGFPFAGSEAQAQLELELVVLEGDPLLLVPIVLEFDEHGGVDDPA